MATDEKHQLDQDHDEEQDQLLTGFTDLFAEEDTAWVTYQGTFQVQLRYVDGKLQKAISKKIESFASPKQLRRAQRNPQSVYTNEASAKAYAELVVIGWRGLYDKKQKPPVQIPYTQELSEKLMLRNIDFLNWVSDQSSDAANFMEDEEDSSDQEQK